MIIYLDESGGTTGFGRAGSSKTFNIAILVCDSSDDIRKLIRSTEKRLIQKGWPKREEVKGNVLYHEKGALTVLHVLDKLVTCEFEIDYLSVNKSNISANLKLAPFGILYNYLAGQVLRSRFASASQVELIVDARNKESHNLRHFDGYIETTAYESSTVLQSIRIEHANSSDREGLRAVDIVSWSIFRKYEHGDSRFYNKLKSKMSKGNCRSWFY